MDEGKLFADVKFFIAECDKPDEVRNLLINQGARHINYLTDDVTHVIADRKCPDAEEAGELFDKPVVKSMWVNFCLRTKRIWPTDIFSPFRTIFSDVIASFSEDLLENDSKALQILIISNGGRITRNPDMSTHFVAPSAKPTEFQDKLATTFKIVDPHWILDSVKQKSCCDETLYDPNLLLSPPPPPPPKQPTPSPPQQQPPVTQPQHPQMIESNELKSSVSSDNSNRCQQIGRSVTNQSHEEQARKIDFQPQIRTQTPPQTTQQSQVNAMQQAQMTRAPTMTPNVIRGASPRFRPLLPPSNQRQQTQRLVMAEQQPRRAPPEYNQAYRKVGPYPYNSDMHQAQQQQMQQPHSQSQGQPYQQVEHAQMHPHGAAINQPMRMAQSNMYHQVRPSYQNSHIPSRMPVAHPNTMNPQPMQQQPIQRFQDPNSQMPQTRPYQISAPQQQHQTVNQNYQQIGMQRQPIYYNQSSSTQPMRAQQPGPMVRSTTLSNDQMMANDHTHHRFPNQMQAQQQPVYQQQRNQLQQPPQAMHRSLPQKSQSFQQPHPPVIPNQSQLQPNMPNSQVLRTQRNPIGNPPDIKISNARQSGTPQGNEKIPRASRNLATQQQPHPSIFDIKQESSYAQMKAKVPILTDGVQYYNYAPEHVVPKGKPFFGCKFKLIEHDDLNTKERQYFCDAISSAGGVFEENLENLTHLICESRSSSIFARALEEGVRCVTLYWIHDVLSQDRLEYPWRALHIPTCYSKDDKHLKDQIISTTNLRKQDRRNVQIMIKTTGAKYTDYLSRKNTLLICGSPEGEKFERAIEWGIPVANCLLISDYLISGRKFDRMLDHAKYQNFNRGDQLKLDSYDLIKELMIPWTKPIPASIEEPNTNGISKDTLTATIDQMGDIAPDLGCNIGAISNNLQSETVANSNEADNINVKKGDDESVEKNDLKTPTGEPSQTEDSMVTDQSTIVNTSDVSAIVDSTAKSESTLLNQTTSTTESTEDVSKKESESSVMEVETRKVVARKVNSPVRVLFTRLKPALQEQLEKHAIKLGFGFASCPEECTHLVVDRISRSSSFIQAFSHADFILSCEWLIDSEKYGKPLDEMAYILQDKEGEKEFSFDLIHSLMKRKKRDRLLFRDFVFFVTPTPLKDVTKLKAMIESAGALAETNKLPTRDQISRLRAEGKRLVVLTDKQDLYLLDSIVAYGVDLMDKEFVLSGILRQDLDFDSHRLNALSTNGHQKELTDTVHPSPQKKIRHI